MTAPRRAAHALSPWLPVGPHAPEFQPERKLLRGAHIPSRTLTKDGRPGLPATLRRPRGASGRRQDDEHERRSAALRDDRRGARTGARARSGFADARPSLSPKGGKKKKKKSALRAPPGSPGM